MRALCLTELWASRVGLALALTSCTAGAGPRAEPSQGPAAPDEASAPGDASSSGSGPDAEPALSLAAPEPEAPDLRSPHGVRQGQGRFALIQRQAPLFLEPRHGEALLWLESYTADRVNVVEVLEAGEQWWRVRLGPGRSEGHCLDSRWLPGLELWAPADAFVPVVAQLVSAVDHAGEGVEIPPGVPVLGPREGDAGEAIFVPASLEGSHARLTLDQVALRYDPSSARAHAKHCTRDVGQAHSLELPERYAGALAPNERGRDEIEGAGERQHSGMYRGGSRILAADTPLRWPDGSAAGRSLEAVAIVPHTRQGDSVCFAVWLAQPNLRERPVLACAQAEQLERRRRRSPSVVHIKRWGTGLSSGPAEVRAGAFSSEDGASPLTPGAAANLGPCFADADLDDFTGSFELRIEVTAAGQVRAAQVRDPSFGPETSTSISTLSACLESEALTWRFQPTADGRPAVLTRTYNLNHGRVPWGGSEAFSGSW